MQRLEREREGKRGQIFLPPRTPKIPGVQYKALLVVGATGSGKSTLLNSLVTYLHDVEIDEPCRYALKPVEQSNHLGNQADSQTVFVTPYNIKTAKFNFGLTLIDTPGIYCFFFFFNCATKHSLQHKCFFCLWFVVVCYLLFVV